MGTGAAEASAEGSRRRILVVHDDRDVARLTADYLEHLDGRVRAETATVPGTALAERELERFDCVVCDYVMPGVDGVRFYRHVRERAADLPVVVFSSVDPDRTALETDSRTATFAFVRKGGRAGQFERLAEYVDRLVGRASGA